MNHFITILVVALAVSAIPSTGSAQIKGSAMGNVVSVIADGPFDAARNPALLSMQTTDRSAAAYVRYRVVDDTDIEYKTSLVLDADKPETINAGGIAAYSMKLSGAVLGFAMGEIGGDLISLRKSRSTIYYTYKEMEEEKICEVNPSLAVALALPFGNGSSIGFQVITTAGYKITDKTKDFIFAGLPIARLDTNRKKDQSLSARAGFGYSKRTQNTQVGFLLRPGTVTLRKQELEYRHVEYDIVTPSLSGTDSTPWRVYYTESPQFVVGGYHRFSPLLGFALEAVYTLSNTSYNRERDINVSVTGGGFNDSILAFHRNYTNTTDAALLLKGGIEFNPGGGLAFTLGGGYDYRKASSESETMNRVRIRSTLEIWYAMLGAHYALNAGTDISLLISGGYVKTEARLEQESLYSLDLDSTLLILDTGVAVTTRY